MGFVHPTLGTWSVMWVVKTVYVGNVLSEPAFSNSIVGGIPVGLLSGTVTNLDNGFPLFGATININPGAHILQTDYNGHYELVLFNGNYNVTASLINYTDATTDVIITDGDTTLCNLQLDLVEANPDTPEVIAATALLGCSPNPFSTHSTIRYAVKAPCHITLEVFNLLGQKISTLLNTEVKSGNFTCQWNGTDNNGRRVSNGIYYLRMTAGDYSSSRKLVLLK